MDRKVSISFNDLTVKQALKKLSNTTGFAINFSSSKADPSRRITKNYTQTRLANLIKEIWGTENIKIEATGSTIDIFIKPEKSKGNLRGVLKDEEGKSVPFASVVLKGSRKGVTANEKGEFEIEQIQEGPYTLAISSVGYTPREVEVDVLGNRVTNLEILLPTAINTLAEVVVTGESRSAEISQQPLQISSINVVPLQNETADVINILDRTTGVRTRQSGGFGGITTIQLNGFSGRAVRIYYDGTPLELYGSSLQLNNIPSTNVDRIDVFKGVMPIDVGTDALAGGINIISKQIDHDYLDVSYQVGSFNTHNTTLNLTKRLSDNLYFSITGFYNYSDNDYETKATQRLPNFTEQEVTVNRFHSAHESYLINGTLGVENLSWTDEMKYSFGINGRDDELQHGIRLPVVPAGDATFNTQGVVHNLSYKKSFFDDKFAIQYFGNYLTQQESIRDSTLNQYDWFGNVVDTRSSDPSEILGNPSQRDGEMRSHAHRLNLSYTLRPNHILKISSFYTDQRIEGEDPVQVARRGFDPNSIPSQLRRSVSGVSYESKWLKQKLEGIVFGKYYAFDQSIEDFRLSDNTLVTTFRQDDQAFGAGMGLKYLFKENFFLKTSFERALRIPDSRELFGDFITIEPNFLLEPERSDNLNLGGYYAHHFGKQKSIILDLNVFFRFQQNLIRLEPGRNLNDPAQYINEAEVTGKGVELSAKFNLVRNFEFTSNITLQNLEKAGEPTTGNTNGVGFAIPNIPFNFFNLEGRYQIQAPWSREDRLSVFSYFTFVEEFDLILQPTRNDDNIIPTQRQLDFGLNYAWKKPNLTFSFQVNNVLNQEVFDNYRVPNPGRNYAFKIRYQRFKL
ncbi:MAG: TonB-dependent receptor [Bacteroidota bacterium]